MTARRDTTHDAASVATVEARRADADSAVAAEVEASRPGPRDGRLTSRVTLVLVLLFVGYTAVGWAERIGDDLNWDETLNYRTYSRHPLTALGLYREPNNHPLDSLYKSLFYVVAPPEAPWEHRLPGIALALGYLVVVGVWFRALWTRGAKTAACACVLLFLGSEATFGQAMLLRGYFPSMLLLLVYLYLLVRRTGMLDGAPAPAMSRGDLKRFAVLSALILFTLPSNLIAMSFVWPLTARAFAGARPSGTAVRTVKLVGASAVLTLLLYSPILIGLVAGVSALRNVPHAPVDDRLGAALGEAAQVAFFASPLDTSWFVLVGAASIAGLAAVAARRAGTFWCVALAASALLVPGAAAAISDFPDRVKTPFAVPLMVAVVLLLRDAESIWSPRVRALCALAVIGAAGFSVPEMIRESEIRPQRANSELAKMIADRTRGRSVVVCHENLQTVILHLRRELGADRVCDTRSEMVARFTGGEALPDRYRAGSWQQRLRDTLFESVEKGPLAVDDIEVLVLVDDLWLRRRIGEWDNAVLDELRARLPQVTRVRHSHFELIFHEARPAEDGR